MFRLATDYDFLALDGEPAPPGAIGWVWCDNGRARGLGYLWLRGDRLYAGLSGEACAIGHRLAVRVLGIYAEYGIKVWAAPDPDIPKAQEWLVRLGFVSVEGDDWCFG